MINPPVQGWHLWKPGAWLRVTGEDAPGFLQGQFSNDVRQAGPGKSVYGLWLNEKGKVIADCFVIGSMAGQAYWVGSYFSAAGMLQKRLESFIVADDVTVDDLSGEFVGISLFGEAARDWLSLENRDGVIFRGRRYSGENWEWVFPSQHLPAVKARLAGVAEVSPAEMERRRIEAGIPSIPADIGAGDLPHEGGLFEDAVSTTKGCYLGQEVMARIKSRGKVRRRLARVHGAGPIPALPAGLWQSPREVGQLRSAALSGSDGYIGLAMLPAEGAGPGAAFSLAAEAAATVHSVP